ncbi:unnamed protein product [Calicophoron daubneyi]|uniref:Ig-like domain-containing protein n=1 Tax=Calicophoron daubneyi TaxID=300641 RepID=A0AAV2SZG2_CALDB
MGSHPVFCLLTARIASITALFILTILGLCQFSSSTVQVVPQFTDLPPSASHFVLDPDSEGLNLVCRAWPPNAKVYLLASQLSAPVQLAEHGMGGADVIPPATITLGSNALLPIPQGLGSQRYGLVSHSQIASLSASTVDHHGQVTSVNLLRLIKHESLSDAVRERPASAVNDEVAVRLTVKNASEIRQLELMRLHCLVATTFGRILSAPFHVLPASLGEFVQSEEVAGRGMLSGDASAPYTSTSSNPLQILLNNIAIVDCFLPLNSYPTPVVHFELNNTLIPESAYKTDKYRQVWRTDGRRVSLLIRKFQARDAGTYRCVVTNPLTMEKKYAPESVHLTLLVPTSPVRADVIVPLASNPTKKEGSSINSQEIVVREGDNITLFCIIHSAPPPTVKTYQFEPNFTTPNRFQLDDKFGLLQISNVQPKDAGFYICSDHQISSTAQLRVKERLHFHTKPQDVRVRKLGDGAQFRCVTSDSKVTPYWLFNGQPKSTTGIGSGSTLTISNVTQQDLGIYQCIAHRKTGKVLSDEWVSASAILASEGDQIIRTPDELAVFTPTTPQPSLDTTPEITTAELTPNVQRVFDNLAVYIVWQPIHQEAPGTPAKNTEYRLEYSVQRNSIEEQQSASNGTRTPSALIGLVGHEAVRWSDPAPIKQRVTTHYAYVVGDPLEASKRYRFRVIAVDPSTGTNFAHPSDWSNVVSMEHISSVDPPVIKIVRPLSKGRVHLVWTFNGSKRKSVTYPSDRALSVLDESALATSSSSDALSDRGPFPLEPDPNVFLPDYFLVLARPAYKVKNDGSSESYGYGAYIPLQVNGSNAREGMLTGLNQTAGYQLVVYGVRGEGEKRQITRFSKAAFVNLATASNSGHYSLLQSLANNRLMYIILGGIAGLMFVVVFVFILLCLCRQHRDRSMNTQRKKQNGFVQSYKDANQYIPVATTDGSCVTGGGGGGAQHHSAGGSLSNQGNGGATMMMTNLQCSAFSDNSASNPGQTANSMHVRQQQQQGGDVKSQQFYYQQQQADQYAAAAALSKEMMQQQHQHQSMLGSQMQLQQPQVAQNNQGPQQIMMYHPAHHQSHHSLLLAGVNNPGPMLAAQPGMYHSGTLPGGPRYMRQNFMGHQFGSQQPLNRATTPANPMDPTDYYQQQQQQQQQHPQIYAHQQPQLPPVPHPQSTADLPPPHPNMNNGAGNRQMVYYPGFMTPGVASLKREPPTGGSRQDSSAYGTLLQRGQLTGSMINDPSMGPISPRGYPAAYYQDGQQVMHMYPDGISTPQPTHAGLYSPQQQQQAYFAQQQQQQQQLQQYQGFYGQQMQQAPDGMSQGPPVFGHTDGESIYSYFSQQDAGQANPHQPLNPLPEENQGNGGANSGFVESGMQTGDANGNVGTGTDDSPAPGGNHRHHRRRRRKQPQQQRQTTGELANGASDSNPAEADGAEGDGRQQYTEQQEDDQLEQRPTFDEDVAINQKQRHLSSVAGSNGGPYSESDPACGQPNFSTPSSYAQQQAVDPARNGGYLRYDSSQRGQMFAGQLPPPNQPPPPPPPPAVAMNLGSPNMTNGGIPNEYNPQGPVSYSGQPPLPHYLTNDSMSRRAYSPSGIPGNGGYSSGSGTGLLVGPPPRIRDYSEYGIPRGIGLPPTPAGGGQPQPPQHNVLMGTSPPPRSNNGTMMYEGRYREGQA